MSLSPDGQLSSCVGPVSNVPSEQSPESQLFEPKVWDFRKARLSLI